MITSNVLLLSQDKGIISGKLTLSGSGGLATVASPSIPGSVSFVGPSGLDGPTIIHAGNFDATGSSSLAPTFTFQVLQTLNLGSSGALGLAGVYVVHGKSGLVNSYSTAGLPEVQPKLALTILSDTAISTVPAAVTVALTGAPASTAVTFDVDGTTIGTVTSDPMGQVWTTLVIPDSVLAGNHTLGTSAAGAQPATASFSTSAAASPYPSVPSDDTAPVLVPAALTSSGIYRWVLQDLMPGGLGSYVMPSNPTSMSNPEFQRNVAQAHTTAVRTGVYHISEAGAAAIDWSFTGVCWTQEHADKLLAYGDLDRRFYIIDHRNRAWKVAFTSVELVPRKRTNINGAYTDLVQDYTVRALIYDQDWSTPQ